MADDLHPAIASRLDDDGQRYTSGRRKLVEVLEGAGRPLTAAEVLVEGDLAQSSAYRNLAVLESCGIVNRVAGSDEFARFELAEDLTDHHHHHLICTSCGAVADFTAPDGLERSLDELMAEVARTAGFQADHHRLDLFGRCARCHDL
ncbi:Fur family transcriptional regulator [Aquihabitans sp. McL0605]|uniref:Fur family transcriptional regulator n=1 Tax=Aquihabitans sp. McL0605 TaxID=3415671 RepID=UPI003CFB3394